MTLTTDELQKLLDAATPAMNGLKRISADDWSIDGPNDFSFVFVGREEDAPRLIVIERGYSSTADVRIDAIEALCIAAPALAAELIAARAKNAAAEKLAEALRDFATAKIDALRYQPAYGESPEDEPDPVVEADYVWALQADAKGAIAAWDAAA